MSFNFPPAPIEEHYVNTIIYTIREHKKTKFEEVHLGGGESDIAPNALPGQQDIVDRIKSDALKQENKSKLIYTKGEILPRGRGPIKTSFIVENVEIEQAFKCFCFQPKSHLTTSYVIAEPLPKNNPLITAFVVCAFVGGFASFMGAFEYLQNNSMIFF